MALKKSQLYQSLWQSCDELRGGMDASQYKDYVLTLLFMKYVSDKYAGIDDAIIVVPPGASFDDMVKLKGDKEIGDKINKIINAFAHENDLDFLINAADFNDETKLGQGKDMQDRLSRLVAIFEGLDFTSNRAEGDDLLGDAYEYLMKNFATESGKSKGQFYTPAEVSRIMAKVIGIEEAKNLSEPTVYDPTCGSGSLLIKAANETTISRLAIFGQEMDNATWALAKMNMILHEHPTAEIWRGNTLAAPHFKNHDGTLKAFDFAVANPPFSSKSWTNGLDPYHDEFGRFEYGVPPAKNGDYAFLLHLIKSLKSHGKGAIILPHGVLFRGNKEADIRKNLIKRGYIKGIIGLPSNLFYGTGIPACIIVIDKENATVRTGIFMIDASKGFMKDGNKNRLRSQDIHKIVDVFRKQTEIPRYSRMVPLSEIASPTNDYNLNIPRYIDSSEPEDLHDLDAHLNGGIPERDIDDLRHYWKVFPALREALVEGNGRPGYLEPKVKTNEIKQTILEHKDFQTFSSKVNTIFDKWSGEHEPLLKGIALNDAPKLIIQKLSEDLLESFADVSLLDPYDIYQRLMDYWDDEMQDDVYLIAVDGWLKASKPRGIISNKERKINEKPDLTIGKTKYKMDLIPPELIVARYFSEENAEIEQMVQQQEEASREIEEFVEENTGEEGLLEEAVNEKGSVTKSAVTDRLKELGRNPDPEFEDEHKALSHYLELYEAESAAKKAIKDAQSVLDKKVLQKYGDLTEEDIKRLVVEDKWFSKIRIFIEEEVEKLTQGLSNRIKELEERYSQTLPDIEKEVDRFSRKVAEHLKKMGLVWND